MAYNEYKDNQSWAGTNKRTLSPDDSSDEPVLAVSSRSGSDGGCSGSGSGSGSGGSGSKSLSQQNVCTASITHVTDNISSDSQGTSAESRDHRSQETSQEPTHDGISEEDSLKSISPQNGVIFQGADSKTDNEAMTVVEANSGVDGDSEVSKDKVVRTRRKNSELKKSFACEYDRCGRAYASHHARWLHYRLKHKQGDIFTEMKKKHNTGGTQNLVPIQSSGSMSVMSVLVMGAMHSNSDAVQQNQTGSIVQTSQGPMEFQGTAPIQSQSVMVQTHQMRETMMINTQHTMKGQPQMMTQPLHIAQPMCVRRATDGQLMIAVEATQPQHQHQQQQQQPRPPHTHVHVHAHSHSHSHSQRSSLPMSVFGVDPEATSDQSLSSGPKRRFTTGYNSAQDFSGGYSSQQSLSGVQHSAYSNRKPTMNIGHKYQTSHHRHHYKQSGQTQKEGQVQSRGLISGDGHKPSRKRNRANTVDVVAEATVYQTGNHQSGGTSSEMNGMRHSFPQDYSAFQNPAQQQNNDQQKIVPQQQNVGTQQHAVVQANTQQLHNAHQWGGVQHQNFAHVQGWKRSHHQIADHSQGKGRATVFNENANTDQYARSHLQTQAQGSCSSSDGSTDSGQKVQCTCSNQKPVRQGHGHQPGTLSAAIFPATQIYDHEQVLPQFAYGHNVQAQGVSSTEFLHLGHINEFKPFHDAHVKTAGQDHVQVQHVGYPARQMDFFGLNYTNERMGADSAYASERSHSYIRNDMHGKHNETANMVYGPGNQNRNLHHTTGNNKQNSGTGYTNSFNSSSKNSYNNSSEGSSEESGPGNICGGQYYHDADSSSLIAAYSIHPRTG
ncbi:hypothetical protein SARC_09293 [Sphaeroforma arctica JP610]|uniref:C2H2-type domain-containing protein n=1 Tax=Sphaeroforma arctica JP610 TaxID=667725 RepID=A0A0L0FN96_9EUKA|nr:hypothetical protein SARC_09293 [Sphaeroforma arctica JP610]KNC78265.1 hypothetical protein SARC_09293 [Sphaeroforma arctica JP610]|eukprot:XP_014152167.1 hypothetical protein SARC_09293 [Sphaeroforma arctica JP610]